MASRTPPNGSRGRPRLTLSDWSMAHIRSERTIDTSSMTRNLSRRMMRPLRLRRMSSGRIEARREAEEGVDGLAADVDRGKAGGRHDHHLGGDHVADGAQQRGFAGAGAAGDEQVAGALAQVIVGGEELRGRLHAGRPSAGAGATIVGAARGLAVTLAGLRW